ncbi:2-amino-4-hydroxy-6-hydroxymethyldihydropteridine diphosphokinase [Microbacterium sp. SLBN-111]|uniref:2-amino-4-hydroxy-6- hydroxymethyldihydropteridine diphosphokinase n=1 Tax=Microbacterium sp. SLBN-111 TaxID=3377733 RepID=UPI003C7650CB
MSVRLAHGIGDPPADHPVAAVVALGANLGSRAETLAAAVEELRLLPLTTDVRVSAPIETVAVTLAGEDADAPRYLNAVALLQTRLAPTTLLRELHRIEAEHGRVRREKWGDRTLDLDLITYGDERIDDERLTVPHPRAHEREFVLAPWVAIDPDAVIPGRGRVDALLAGVRGGAGQDARSGGGAGQGARPVGGAGQDAPSVDAEGKDTP